MRPSLNGKYVAFDDYQHLAITERASMAVISNQVRALIRWVEHTVPEWTQEVQCCMDDCEKTCKRIDGYLTKGKTQ